MKIIGFKTDLGDMVISKGFIAGAGLVGFGIYLIVKDSQDFGYAMLLNGFGLMGIRDAQ